MKRMNRKQLAAVLAIFLLLAVAVGGTIAYLAAATDPLVNTFTPSKVTVDITDEVDDTVKSNVVIKNTGTANAYIRARIVGSWVDNETGVTVQAWNPESDGTFDDLPGTGWVQQGDYYYYTSPVAPEATTDPLFTSYTVTGSVEGAHLVMDILVQAIQAEGGAAEAAWGSIPTPSPAP